ncbi:Histone-lysine N-methyltransferase SMYD3 [Lamellibrachia satsuma]|nr:Histone-lysine N-methyltransferase SMYD3 [Lamellibrachia satsuma]
MFVVKCKPYAHVLSGSERNSRCDECLNSPDKLLRCSACHVAWFCSKLCQRRAWLLHKAECACLQRVAPRIPTDSVRFFFRILLKQQSHEHRRQVDDFLGVKRSFADLESHVEEIKKDPKRMEEFLVLSQTLRVFVGDDWPMPGASELLQVFGKMVINSFSICDGEMQPIGVGIYLGASCMDHSCRPNAIAVFSGTELHVRNTVAIDTSQPIKFYISYIDHEHNIGYTTTFYISYIDQLLPRSERRTQLVMQYYFTCDCPVCTDDHQEKMMLSIKCPTENCRAAITQREDGSIATCHDCKRTEFDSSYTRENSKLVAHSQMTLEKVKQLKKDKDYEAVLETCENCLQKQQQLLHQNNIYVVQITDCAFDAAIQLSNWLKALEYGCRTLEQYRLYYPKYHPNVGGQLIKVGKIQLYLQRSRQAMTTLIEAESIIDVTHGKEHLYYRELAQLLDQCTAELKC